MIKLFTSIIYGLVVASVLLFGIAIIFGFLFEFSEKDFLGPSIVVSIIAFLWVSISCFNNYIEPKKEVTITEVA